MGTQMEPLWRGLLNIYPQQYLSIRHTIWIVQDHRLNYRVHMIFLSINFGIWISGFFPDGSFRPISMIEVWRALGLIQNRLEQLSSLRHELATRWEILMPGKYGMASLMLALNEAETRTEAIPVHMNQGHNVTKHMKYRCETPTLLVHVGNIDETTTLYIPTEE